MAKRTTPEEVEVLIRDYDESISLDPFIEIANIVTDDVAAQDTGGKLSSARLAAIEKYLAGHFYRGSDHALSEEETGDASGKYTEEFGPGLEGTYEGKRAIFLDITGYLRTISNGKTTAGAVWLGKVPSAQTDAIDRA